MTEYIAYLPFGDLKNAYGADPLKWLFENFKGKFRLVNLENKNCSEIHFEEKQDMELFILTWGEYLWSKDDLSNM